MTPEGAIERMRSSHLRHILETKGLFHGAERLGQILWRFSFGRRRFLRMLRWLERGEWPDSARVTFCVASALLKRHADLIQRLGKLGHEIASHGVYHSRMSILDLGSQKRILDQSYRHFQDVGLAVDGFRCPYLSFNDDTLEALQDSRYSWTSQQIILWRNGSGPLPTRLDRLYNASVSHESPSLPRPVGRLLEVPITAPDDEMFIERFRVRDQNEISRQWQEIFHDVHERGEIFHLLFHPERFFMVEKAMVDVVRKAEGMSPEVWLPTLGELSEWWSLRRAARWRLEADGEGGRRAWIQAPARASVLLQQPCDADSPSPLGEFSQAPVVDERGPERCYRIGERGRTFSVGIAPDSPPSLEDFLLSEGFIVERSDDPQAHSFYVADGAAFRDNGKRPLLSAIERCPRPLLRLWRWPDRARSVLVISSDVDSIDLIDFWERSVHFGE